MPILKNSRHELFAESVASGKTQEQAYIDAGYAVKDARAKASRLMATNGNIAARVQELKERAAKRVEITQADIIESLLRIAGKGEGLGEAAGLSVARASYMDAAKLAGLVVDKSENKHSLSFEDQLKDLA